MEHLSRKMSSYSGGACELENPNNEAYKILSENLRTVRIAEKNRRKTPDGRRTTTQGGESWVNGYDLERQQQFSLLKRREESQPEIAYQSGSNWGCLYIVQIGQPPYTIGTVRFLAIFNI